MTKDFRNKKGSEIKYLLPIKIMKKEKSFTLIELLVVIAIISFLTISTLAIIGPQRKKSRDTRRQVDLKQISTAMEMCYGDSNCNGGIRYLSTTAGINTVTSISTFMSPVPCDPGGCAVGYNWTANSAAPAQQYYCAYAQLEGTTNAFVCVSNKGIRQKTTPFACAPDTAPCNDDCCGFDLIP